jgi:ribosomal-protein-alanine N-acetyltransferase
MHLSTSRLVLRPIRPTDEAEWVRVHEISRDHFKPWRPRTSEYLSLRGRFRETLTHSKRGEDADLQYSRFAFLKSGRLVGQVTISGVVRGAHHGAFLGYWVSADQIGQGYATEMVSAMLDWALAARPEGLGIHRVQAAVIPENERSRRVVEKLGFRLEGRAKGYIRIDGTWRDHDLYAKLAEEHFPPAAEGAANGGAAGDTGADGDGDGAHRA